MWVEISEFGTHVEKTLSKWRSRRFTLIRDVCLVCNTKKQDFRSLNCLAQRVQEVLNTTSNIRGHTVVDFFGELNKAERTL